jgi:FtsP/CotA-like multicopper oxidase with cupredoxin domain
MRPTIIPKPETDNKFYRPPPTTVVNLGDEIHLTVINNLDAETSTTLHAHGFHQLNNNQYDGPEGITQWYVGF